MNGLYRMMQRNRMDVQSCFNVNFCGGGKLKQGYKGDGGNVQKYHPFYSVLEKKSPPFFTFEFGLIWKKAVFVMRLKVFISANILHFSPYD